MKTWVMTLSAGIVVFMSGCHNADKSLDPTNLFYADRLDQGYTIVATGLVGRTKHNLGLVRALESGPAAVELHDWTVETPFFKRFGLEGNPVNEREAEKLAAKIVAYQDQYPGRPVHLIGLCAGTGLLDLALRKLPLGRRVTSVVFLAPDLSPNYDLKPAIERTELGIHSYHSPLDLFTLVGLTSLFGTMDGWHGPAAGAFGFRSTDDENTTIVSRPRLYEHGYSLSMLSSGNWGGHYGWVEDGFVEEYLIPHLSARRSGFRLADAQASPGTESSGVFMVTGHSSKIERLPPVTR